MLTFILNSDFKIIKSNFQVDHDSEKTSSLRGSEWFLDHISNRDRTQVTEWLRANTKTLQDTQYFSMIDRNFNYVHVSAQAVYFKAGDEGFFSVSANLVGAPPRDRSYRQLEEDLEFYRTVIKHATEALWCIEYHKPVDLTEPTTEIVRQVFENPSRWRICNAAVSKLYGVPDHIDVNAQPVNRYFSKSAANLRYVQRLIASEFWVDGAVSTDLRHDGTAIFVENTVRSTIINNKLIRFWGTMHDVTQAQKSFIALRNKSRITDAELNSVPVPIITLNIEQNITRLSKACEEMTGLDPEDWLGRNVVDLIDLSTPLKRSYEKDEYHKIPARFTNPVLSVFGLRSVLVQTVFLRSHPIGHMLTLQSNTSLQSSITELSDAV